MTWIKQLSTQLSANIFEAFVLILLNVNFSLNQTLVTFLLNVKQTWMTHWFWQFHCEGLSSFNSKRFYSHIHGLAVYVKKGLPLSWDLSPENSADSSLCFRQALLHSVSYFFFLYWSPSLSLGTVFDSVSPNMDEVLSIIPSANVFVFRVIIDRPGGLYYNFSTPNDLT